jgi:hypothetical protein
MIGDADLTFKNIIYTSTQQLLQMLNYIWEIDKVCVQIVIAKRNSPHENRNKTETYDAAQKQDFPF